MNSFKILCCAGSFVGFSFMSAAGWLVAQDAPNSDVPPAVTEAVTEEPEASKSESKTAENPTTSTSLAQEKQEAASTDSNDTQEESLKRARSGGVPRRPSSPGHETHSFNKKKAQGWISRGPPFFEID